MKPQIVSTSCWIQSNTLTLDRTGSSWFDPSETPPPGQSARLQISGAAQRLRIKPATAEFQCREKKQTKTKTSPAAEL